jgi:hypothetical protein
MMNAESGPAAVSVARLGAANQLELLQFTLSFPGLVAGKLPHM